MVKAYTLKELAERGELPARAAEKMAKNWVTNVNELYNYVRCALEIKDAEVISRLADDLGMPESRLEGFMNYIKPYVSEQVLNPAQVVEHPMGCRISQESLDRIFKREKILDENPEEYDNLKRASYMRAMMNDPSFERYCYKSIESNPMFREWILTPNLNTSLDKRELAERIKAKHAEIVKRFGKR
jgi:hypothetical protein